MIPAANDYRTEINRAIDDFVNAVIALAGSAVGEALGAAFGTALGTLLLMPTMFASPQRLAIISRACAAELASIAIRNASPLGNTTWT